MGYIEDLTERKRATDKETRRERNHLFTVLCAMESIFANMPGEVHELYEWISNTRCYYEDKHGYENMTEGWESSAVAAKNLEFKDGKFVKVELTKEKVEGDRHE